MLISTSCSHSPKVDHYYPDQSGTQEPALEELFSEYYLCTGRGILNASGSYAARLNFTFSAWNDSSAMNFSDILGRRILIINTIGKNIIIKDLLNNKIINENEIITVFPIFGWMNSQSLTETLWGIPPTFHFSDDSLISNNTMGTLDIEQSNSKHGQILSALSYSSYDNNDKVKLEFHKREYKENEQPPLPDRINIHEGDTQ